MSGLGVYLAQGATHSYSEQLQGTDNSCSRTGHVNRSPAANTRSTCMLFGFKDMDLHYLRSGPSVTNSALLPPRLLLPTPLLLPTHFPSPLFSSPLLTVMYHSVVEQLLHHGHRLSPRLHLAFPQQPVHHLVAHEARLVDSQVVAAVLDQRRRFFVKQQP